MMLYYCHPLSESDCMRITITIDTDNEAFSPSPLFEAGRILGKLADEWQHTTFDAPSFNGHRLRDINGNTVGKVTVKE